MPYKKKSPLSQGNHAMRAGHYAEAVTCYAQTLINTPALGESISANLSIARRKYRVNRKDIERPRVAVCSWELAHNPAGRAYTLATIYQTFSDAEIIGSIFPGFGRDIWEPIRKTTIPKHLFLVEDEAHFVEQAIALVAAHPYDIVHLSKPRAPNIIFGILYKLLWDAKVLMDIDDEELGFVDADSIISPDDYLKQHGHLPSLSDLSGKDWTRLAVGLVDIFDGITVSNPALQQRYGGEIIRHARDEEKFQPSMELKRKNREKFSIAQDKKVVLFFGTPREHKGLKETAEAIAALERDDVLFVVAGDFLNNDFKRQLQQIKKCHFMFIGNQPVDATPDVVSIADCCVFLQDKSLAAQYQVPAKLSDALGMGVPIFANHTPALDEFFRSGAVVKIVPNELKSHLSRHFAAWEGCENHSAEASKAFDEMVSIKASSAILKSVVSQVRAETNCELGFDRIQIISRMFGLEFLAYVVSSDIDNLLTAGNACKARLHNERHQQITGNILGGFGAHRPLTRSGRDNFTLRGLRPFADIAVVANIVDHQERSLVLKALQQLGVSHDLFILGEFNTNEFAFSEITVSITQVGNADVGGNAQAFLRLANSNVFDDYRAVLWISPGEGGATSLAVVGSAEKFCGDPQVGIQSEGLSTVSQEEDGRLISGIKTALPRLGLHFPSRGAMLPTGPGIWLKPFLLRGLAIALRPDELTRLDDAKGLPGRTTVLLLLSILASEAGMALRCRSTSTEADFTHQSKREVKTVAFYLPQFHPIPENNLWWGKGFTEWTNVTRGRQLFRGHYQPRVPTELGYYDLRLEDIQVEQAKLATEFGIHGFCYYYYWFNGKKLLNHPIEQMARSKRIDTGFCVCWANENWSRNWDGQNRHVLIEQIYTLESNIALIRELIPMMKDPRWIRYNGRPVMMVYRITIIPNWLETAMAWREECRKAGLGEIHLCAVRFGLEALGGVPRDHGIDSYVLFPPHESARLDRRNEVLNLDKEFNGQIFDYTAVVDADLERFNEVYPWPVHRGAMLGWDNTARRLTDARIFHGATPYGFRRWMKGILEQEIQMSTDNESLVFINAWNEWAEGTYLEPDQRWGRAYLKAFNSAVEATPGVCSSVLQRGVASLPRGTTALEALGNPLSDIRLLAFPEWHQGSRSHNPDCPTVLLCAHIAGHHLFGGERSLLDVLDALASLPLNVVMTLPSGNNKAYIREICACCLGVYSFTYPQWRDDRSSFGWLTTTFADIIARHAVDVVHSNTIVLLEPAAAALRMHRTRVVHSRELISLDDSLREGLGSSVSDIVSRVFRNSDWLIGNSQATCHLFSRPGKTLYVPNAVNIDDFDVQNRFGNTIKFGIVSSNIPKKGIIDFVEIARQASTRIPRAKFVIVGPITEQLKQWQEEVAAGTRPDNLIIAGYVNHPRKAMSELNVLLNLSHFAESFGRTVAEGMAARRPVIAYDWGALAELVQHENTGLLVPYKDIDGVVDAIARICNDDSLISSMGEAGRAFVAQNFSKKILRSAIAEAYGAILEKDPSESHRQATGAIAYKSFGMPTPRTTVIIPVYNAPDEVYNCIASVVRHTDLIRNRVLVINDGSQDLRVDKTLAKFSGINGVYFLDNKPNIGYTRTVNRGICDSGDDDVVLLNSDTVVTPRWLEGLRSAAYSRSNVATVTAMSDNAGAFSFPWFNEYCPRPAHLSYEEYALMITQATMDCNPPEVPTGSGFCMFIRREFVKAHGLFDEESFPRGYGEENDFCMRAIKAGWINLISPWSFVYHVRTASFKGEKTALVKAGVDVVTRRYPDYALMVKTAFASSDMIKLREAARNVCK